jgi:hypothetical protein
MQIINSKLIKSTRKNSTSTKRALVISHGNQCKQILPMKGFVLRSMLKMAFIKLLQNVGYQRIDEAIHKIINQWD